MVDAGHTRGTINQNVSRIKRMFRWAASEQLIPESVYSSLATVDGLRRGKTKAVEAPEIRNRSRL